MEYRLKAITPLGEDLLIARMRGHEKLGRLFEYVLDFFSKKSDLSPTSILGQPVTVELGLEDGSTRYFNGLVVHFTQIAQVEQDFYSYQAVLRPWCWVLTRTADCKIFQEKTVPEIIKQVFGDEGFSDFEDQLTADYPILEYCVQYRESDFNFVSRLMEHSGIYYYFKHYSNRHVLVLSDHYSAHSPVEANSDILYRSNVDHTYDSDYIYRWAAAKVIQTGKCVLDDYDFTAPKSNLEVYSDNPGPCPYTDREVYDYPGKYLKTTDGDLTVKARLQELQCHIERFEGTANARQIAVGGLFNLSEYYRNEQNKEYLIVGAEYEIDGRDYISGGKGATEMAYICRFEAIGSQVPYRSERSTPKPLITGPQTATVCGKSGEEIWTDEYGRVKLQFRWDRYGKENEESSCWIRVAQAWAGKNWGSIAIPRIGEEVIVDFLEGDPDQPIITGRVYNADQTTPYKLPENQTQSGTKSRSSKGGTGENFNELRFEDKANEEQIYLHAEKNFDQVTENDHTLTIGFEKKDKGDLTLKVYNDRTATIEQGNDTLQIKTGNQDVTLDKGNQTIVLSMGNQSTTLSKGNHSLKIDLGKSTTEAMQSIELKVGANSIKIDQSGITIKGIMVKIEASATLEAKASAMGTVDGGGMLMVKGGIVMIN
ncbi:MAG: type VI secretion system Vgr family protein [Gammaproteobacteria bacterium]